MENEKNAQLLYVADPMCPWSYGFCREINQLKGGYEDQLEFRVVMGGLQPGYPYPMHERTKHHMADEWWRVHDLTGLPFNFRFFQVHQFVYNTDLPARAVVTVRLMKPELELIILEALQFAFFDEGIDITYEDGLLEVVLKFGIDQEEFLQMLHSEQVIRETYDDYDLAMGLGAHQFPSVYLMTENDLIPLTQGYIPYEELERRLEFALQHTDSEVPEEQEV